MDYVTAQQIDRAKEGDAQALEALVRGIQDRVFKLAVRMLADPHAAQDATQEILIRVVTKLSTYRGDSRFETWVHRVALNYLLTAKKVIANDPGLSFQMFGADLLDGLADEAHAAPEDHVMLNELRIRCTMAMLLCLDRDHRAAYVLGEVLEFDQSEAAEVLEISSANFRKRLSRARKEVQAFTAKSCGLVNGGAACACPRRLPAAQAAGRIGDVATAELADAPGYEATRAMAIATEADLVAAKLQRATGALRPTTDFARQVLKLVEPPG